MKELIVMLMICGSKNETNGGMNLDVYNDIFESEKRCLEFKMEAEKQYNRDPRMCNKIFSFSCNKRKIIK